MTDKKKEEEAALGCLLVLVAFAVSIPGSIYTAWLQSYWWLWFAVPLGAPVINLWHIFGLRLMISHPNMGIFNSLSRVEKKLGTSGKNPAQVASQSLGNSVGLALVLTIIQPIAWLFAQFVEMP